MDFLLDTHAVLWGITNDHQLPKLARSEMENLDNRCFVSIASLWEICIKHSIGKLALQAELPEIFRIIDRSIFDPLPLTPKHVLRLSTLPHFHKDPFDRILIAQAMEEDLRIITKDKEFPHYDVKILWD